MKKCICIKEIKYKNYIDNTTHKFEVYKIYDYCKINNHYYINHEDKEIFMYDSNIEKDYVCSPQFKDYFVDIKIQ